MTRYAQKGSFLIIVMATVLTFSALAIAGMSMYATYVTESQRITNTTDSIPAVTQAALTLVSEASTATIDPVPLAYLAASPAPVGGGQIPMSSIAPKLDGQGMPLGYCTGTDLHAQGRPAFAVVSAGTDKIFQTGCTDALGGTALGDDIVVTKSVADIRRGVGGSTYVGSPVADLPTLEALTTARPGELRVTLNDGKSYINKSGIGGAGRWQLVGGGGIATGSARTCEAGYVPVPAYTLPDGTYVDSFCVMQYEARNVPGIGLTSDINVFGTRGAFVALFNDAKTACASIGGKLITDEEWLSLAHQAIMEPANWTGGTVGSGKVVRGWAANTTDGDAWTNSTSPPRNDPSCLYNTGADQCSSSGSLLYRRTHILHNGSEIWDLTGNLMEATNWTRHIDDLIMMEPTPTYHPYNSQVGDIAYAAVNSAKAPINMLPPNGWNAAQGMGQYLELSSDRATTPGGLSQSSVAPYFCTGWCTPYVYATRGGYVNHGKNAGLFQLWFRYGNGTASAVRCTN